MFSNLNASYFVSICVDIYINIYSLELRLLRFIHVNEPIDSLIAKTKSLKF